MRTTKHLHEMLRLASSTVHACPAEGHMADEHRDVPRDGVEVGSIRPSKASRSVDKLNEEQLARKRAADRKSQQILRQKTRNHIESLEERIRHLENQKSELELAQQRNTQLEEELRNLKAAIASSASITKKTFASKPILPSTLPQIRIDPTQQPIPPRSIPITVKSRDTRIAVPTGIPIPLLAESTDSSTEPSTTPSAYKSNTKRTRRRIELGFGSASPPARSPTPQGVALHPYFIPPSFLKQPSVHAWELPLRLQEPTSPVDKLLYGLIETQKKLLSEGASRSVAIGPLIPNVNVLLAPHLSHLAHPVSRVLCDLLKRMTYRSLIDKLGALLVMYPVYQWQIMNDYESYARIPSHSIPVFAQRSTLHAVWICALGSPKLREMVIADMDRYANEDFIYAFILSINCNWNRDFRDAICWGKDGVSVTKDFWDHCNVLDNWSFDRPFSTTYPELRSAVRFTDYDDLTGVKIEEMNRG
ncbi:uncharacterized protein RSE6_11351 [Rhynchosporium secalis]|uniref:BZIP transcription factor n=1 Tax=Rhynchosporium secalis TaxID=38038 RepID=A0A1E1MMR9_RHYSE|nr:uncharacterized protein RSE6_11351 [Rhynchosporium secalis]